VLYSFTGGNDGQYPTADVTLDSAGNIYGATPSGGASGYGTVFELTPSEGGWVEITLHTFAGGPDGADPSGPVTVDTNGDVYGTTLYGGGTPQCDNVTSGCGTVFRLHAADNWNENLLHRFQAKNDGEQPIGGIVLDEHRNIFGTAQGGKDGYGTVFILTHTFLGWTFYPEPLTNNEGQAPFAGVTLGSRGILYGTTASGLDNNGAVFQLTY
jgi:hypothetical protein